MEFSLFPATSNKASNAKKRFRKCDPRLLERAWEYFWHPDFVARSRAYRKMQWRFFKDLLSQDELLAPHKEKIAAALLYIFACYSASHPEVPIYLLIAGLTSEDEHATERRQLLDEMRNSPRLVEKTCKFVWKTRQSTPESLVEFGALAQVVWQTELLQAELRALKRMQEYKADKQ